jgi:hypothetical protein
MACQPAAQAASGPNSQQEKGRMHTSNHTSRPQQSESTDTSHPYAWAPHVDCHLLQFSHYAVKLISQRISGSSK